MDGRYVYVREIDAESFRIARLDLRTGRREPWKELTPADPAGVHNLWRVLLTSDGRHYAYSYQRDLSDLYLVEGLK